MYVDAIVGKNLADFDLFGKAEEHKKLNKMIGELWCTLILHLNTNIDIYITFKQMGNDFMALSR